MPQIHIDQDVYEFLCRNTQVIGENASSILRRLLEIPRPRLESSQGQASPSSATAPKEPIVIPSAPSQPIPKSDDAKEVDETVQTEDERVVEFLRSTGWRQCEDAVDKFLWILAWLHSHHRTSFHLAEQVRWRERLYFATSEARLEEHGQNVSPRKIMGTGFWVVTNNDTAKKGRIIREAMTELGYRSWNTQRIVAALDPDTNHNPEDVRI